MCNIALNGLSLLSWQCSENSQSTIFQAAYAVLTCFVHTVRTIPLPYHKTLLFSIPSKVILLVEIEWNKEPRNYLR